MNRVGKDIESTPIADYAKYSNKDPLAEFNTSFKGFADKEAKNCLLFYGWNVTAKKIRVSVKY